MHEETLPCFIDVNNFVLCGFGMWMLPYPALRRRALVHSRVPNCAEHTKVEYKAPPRCVWLLYIPVHANYPCILRPLPSEPTTPMVYPHNLSSNNHNLATKHPTPNVDQADATGSAHGSPATAVVPPNHVTLTQHGNSPQVIALWFLLCWQNKF